MKLSLVVVSEGKGPGKAIPITLSQFIIGRDPQCQLRPASALISKRHCAVITRGEKVFVRDFDSTNGTFLNDEPVKGEREVRHEDTLKVGPLTFRVMVEGANIPVNKPTPMPKPAAARREAGSEDDESVGAMLLDLADEGSSEEKKTEGVPDGTTIMDGVTPAHGQPIAGDTKTEEAAGKEAKPPEKKKFAGSGDTSAAAQAILQKYMRRQRT